MQNKNRYINQDNRYTQYTPPQLQEPRKANRIKWVHSRADPQLCLFKRMNSLAPSILGYIGFGDHI